MLDVSNLESTTSTARKALKVGVLLQDAASTMEPPLHGGQVQMTEREVRTARDYGQFAPAAIPQSLMGKK